MKEGDFPAPGERGGCVITADIADILGIGVGDRLSGVRMTCDPENIYDLAPADGTAEFTVCGVVNNTNDHRAQVWEVSEGNAELPLFGYTLASLALENEYATDAVDEIRERLPELTRISLFDQGYGETVKPFRSIASAASDVLAVCAAGAARL